MGRQTEDLTGIRFGSLIPIRFHAKKEYPCGSSEAMWLCQCDCGNTTIVSRGNLKKGTVKSCGCSRAHAQEKFKKSDTYHRLKRIWFGIKTRCCNKNHKDYPAYGGRGICVCDEWLFDFDSFYKWSLNNGYKDDLSIDRICNDRNYEPDNCRWVSQRVQNNNKRTSKFIEFDGQKRTIAEWSEITGICRSTIEGRIKKGLPIEKVLNL